MGYLDGFGVVMKKWFGVRSDTGARVTNEYPEQTRPKPERFHGRHVLNRYEDGMEKCIGCELCAGVCPAKCIYVRGQDNDPEDPTSPGERFGFIYEINYLRCIHCDLCVEACPTEAITETKMFEFAFTSRADAIYTKAELVVGDDGRPQQLPWENWAGGFDAARDSSGWMRATSPSGSAEFTDIISWAGELGYGVRAPQRATIEEESGPVPTGAHHDHDHDAHDHDAHDHDAHGHDAHGHDDHDDHPPAEPALEPRPVKFDAVETELEPAVEEADVEEPAAEAPDPELVDGEASDTVEEPPAPPASTAGFFDAPEEPTQKKRGFRR